MKVCRSNPLQVIARTPPQNPQNIAPKNLLGLLTREHYFMYLQHQVSMVCVTPQRCSSTRPDDTRPCATLSYDRLTFQGESCRRLFFTAASAAATRYPEIERRQHGLTTMMTTTPVAPSPIPPRHVDIALCRTGSTGRCLQTSTRQCSPLQHRFYYE